MWTRILGEAPGTSFLLDSATVKQVELLAPKLSRSDRDKITNAMHARHIFPNVQDLTQRGSILARILEVDGRILSLHTFFQDTKYLEPCASIMKGRLPPKIGISLEQAFKAISTVEHVSDTSTVEMSASRWSTVLATPQTSCRLGYLQLWLYCMRNFPYMQPINPRKDIGTPKPQYELKSDMWPNFAQLASRLYFRSPGIMRLCSQDPFEMTVRSFLQSTRPRDSFQWGPGIVEQETARICELLRSIPARDSTNGQACLVSNSCNQPLLYRCGRPLESAYLAEREFLYLGYIYRNYDGDGMYVSPFGCQRDIFRAFFGDVDLQMHPTHVPLPPSQPPSTPGSTAATSTSSTASTTSELPPDSPAPQQDSPTPNQDPGRSSERFPSTPASDGGVEVGEDPINGGEQRHGLYTNSEQSIPQGTSAIQALNGLETDAVVFYNVHTCKTYPIYRENIEAGCETMSQNFLRLDHAFFGIENDQIICLSKDVLNQVTRYPLRFVAKKGTIATPAQTEQDMTHLIEKFYPGTDVQNLLTGWPYQSQG